MSTLAASNRLDSLAARHTPLYPISFNLPTTSASKPAPLFLDFLALKCLAVVSFNHSKVVLSFPPVPGLLHLILIAATEIPVSSLASSIDVKSLEVLSLKVALTDVSNFVYVLLAII